MTDHFDKWINGMSESDYEDWLEDDASPAQEEKALNIRQPISEDELDELEDEQTFESHEDVIRRERIALEKAVERGLISPSRKQEFEQEIKEDIPKELQPTITESKVVYIPKPEPVVLSSGSSIQIDNSGSTHQRISFGQRIKAFFGRFRLRRR